MITSDRSECFTIQVLGALKLRAAGGANMVDDLTAPKPRKIIALLVMQANRVVPTAAMARELWGDNPPASVQTTLQTYVLQVRRMLSRALGISAAEVARTVLVTKFGGYQLIIRHGNIDAHEFERLLAEGRQALTDGSDETAVRLLTEALELWCGAPLVDVKPGPLLDAEIRRLEENRLTALMQRVDARLRLGRHHELPGELASLVGQYPMNENLHAQYMLALYRCGRCPEALEVFRRLRDHMVGELGLEPSLRIQSLHRAMLAADPALEYGPDRADGNLLLDRLGGAPAAPGPWASRLAS
ncbi:BTAD domain-containing putative transcriptional regulator [Kitasatospora sp. NPDC090091]|uniref:AfsR/SARP family transcriptional regulator n=1 Tax=Kitasatospora sp. NPDC090091 TaxID=3364081 RepID=UPI0038309D81